MNRIKFAFCLIRKGDSYAFQVRDDRPDIASPGKLAAFGGKLEGGESKRKAIIRELEEETSLNVNTSKLKYLGRVIGASPERPGVGYGYILEATSLDFEVYEGQGRVIVSLQELESFDLSKFNPSTRQAIERWVLV